MLMGGSVVDLDRNNTEYSSLIQLLIPDLPPETGQATVYCIGSLSNLQVELSGSPSTGDSYTFTVMVNGAASTLACTISGSSTSGSDTGSISLLPGDTVNIQINPTSDPDARAATWSSEFTILAIPSSGGPIQ
jgi:hypothetical protein